MQGHEFNVRKNTRIASLQETCTTRACTNKTLTHAIATQFLGEFHSTLCQQICNDECVIEMNFLVLHFVVLRVDCNSENSWKYSVQKKGRRFCNYVTVSYVVVYTPHTYSDMRTFIDANSRLNSFTINCIKYICSNILVLQIWKADYW